MVRAGCTLPYSCKYYGKSWMYTDILTVNIMVRAGCTQPYNSKYYGKSWVYTAIEQKILW